MNIKMCTGKYIVHKMEKSPSMDGDDEKWENEQR